MRQKVKHCYFLAIVLAISVFCNANVTRVGKAAKQPSPLINDALIPPDVPPKHNSSIIPGYYETSEYLIGSVAVGIVFLESDGSGESSTEDWTPLRESLVVSEIRDGGLSWLADYNPNASISFVYDIYKGVPTSYEPINHPQTEEGLWISEAMTYLGYPGTSYFIQVRDYINDLRDTLSTDWAFTIFVVDSDNDSDGKFTDDYFAYAYLGGPFLVMTYDNNGYGISNLDFVSAHETCHIFYATDEYDSVTENSGYLNVTDNEGSGDMMDTPLSWSLCINSKEQLGWRDTDGDGIQDILDTLPDTTLNPYVPNPTDNATPVYTGSVTEVPYPNNNPQGGRDVTINTITSVQFRIDYGAWMNTDPTDGNFDEAVEDFTFTTPSLSLGAHTVETRGINSVGNNETSYSSDTVTIEDYNAPTTDDDYDGSWHTTDFTVNLTATDDLSGVAETYYKINGGQNKTLSIDGQPIITTEGANNTLEYWSVDKADHEELPHKNLTGIRLDKTAPTGFITINNGEAYTTSTSVTLTLAATDETSGVFQVRFSNVSLWDTEPWETPSRIKAWTLTSGDGTKDVYYQIKDNAGLVSETYSDTIILDTTPPIGSITINDEATFATTNTVTLNLSATDTTSGIAEMRFSNDNTTWTHWEAYATSKAWTLTIDDGTKTVYYQIRDHAGSISDTYSDTIVLDTNPPTILGTSPGNGNEIKSSTITVTWSGADKTSGIDHYEIRLNDGSWINTGTNTTHTFNQVNDGSNRLDVKVIDKAGNYKQAHVVFSVNTSLIGGPGWTDDIIIFSTIGIIVAVVLVFMLKRQMKSQPLR